MREQTPLHEAIRDVGMVRSLLNKGAGVNCQQDDLLTPLHLAAGYGELRVARVLVEHKTNVDSRDNEGRTPLCLLLSTEDNNCNKGDILDLARSLLEKCTVVNIRTTDSTLLHEAAFRGRLEIVRILLDHGANPNTESKYCETPLHSVSRGKYDYQEHGVNIARLFMQCGVDVNALSKINFTPLHVAAFHGGFEITRLLLNHGANANAEVEGGETALHPVSRGKCDSQENGVGIAQLLLEYGVDVHAQDKHHDTALHEAAFNGRLEIAQLLLDHGANPNTENEQGATPLHSVSEGKYDSQEHGVCIARLLLEHGVDVHAKDKDHDTPLLLAALKGRFQIAQVLPFILLYLWENNLFKILGPQVLLDYGANPNAKDVRGTTPLQSVSKGKYDSQGHGAGIARLLLEHGVDVHARDKRHDTPLHVAAFNGRLNITRVLLDYGANPDAGGEWGETMLHLVSRGEYDSQGHGLGIAQLFLEHGVDIHAQDIHHNTALHSAGFSGRLKIVQILLEHGADVKSKNKLGKTPLHAVSRGKNGSQELGVGAAWLFLEYGVDIDAQDNYHDTALHLAAFRGWLEIVKLLLDHSAKTTAENEQGETPLHLVSRGTYDFQGHGVKTARLLLEHGVDVNAPDKDQNTPLHSASYVGRLEIVQVLLDHGANAGSKNAQAQTPLHLVSQGGYWSQEDGPSVAKLLLEHGGDMNAQDKDYRSPFYLACCCGRLDIARVFFDFDAKAQAEND